MNPESTCLDITNKSYPLLLLLPQIPFYTSSCYVENMLDRVDGTATICQQFKVECAANDFEQCRYVETRRDVVASSQEHEAHEHIHHDSSTRVIFGT